MTETKTLDGVWRKIGSPALQAVRRGRLRPDLLHCERITQHSLFEVSNYPKSTSNSKFILTENSVMAINHEMGMGNGDSAV